MGDVVEEGILGAGGFLGCDGEVAGFVCMAAGFLEGGLKFGRPLPDEVVEVAEEDLEVVEVEESAIEEVEAAAEEVLEAGAESVAEDEVIEEEVTEEL